jgi:hypothetical protein
MPAAGKMWLYRRTATAGTLDVVDPKWILAKHTTNARLYLAVEVAFSACVAGVRPGWSRNTAIAEHCTQSLRSGFTI